MVIAKIASASNIPTRTAPRADVREACVAGSSLEAKAVLGREDPRWFELARGRRSCRLDEPLP